MRWMRIVGPTVLLLAAMFATPANGQVGKDSDLWNWTKDAKHHAAVVKVSLDDEKGVSRAIASGVVVRLRSQNRDLEPGEAHCLTAAHVLEPIEEEISTRSKKSKKRRVIKTTVTVHYRNNKRSRKCKILRIDHEHDIALLLVAKPRDIKAVKLAKKRVKPGDYVEFAGLGGGTSVKRPRHFEALASSPSSESLIYADTNLLPGDSGGAVFNKDKELVGIISGGMIWWNGGVRNNRTGQEIVSTWPARACNVSPINTLAIDDPGRRKSTPITVLPTPGK